ncbi:MAG: hypothetical protein VZR56_12835, partial [Treponema sp.]|nr:hypothetical protein [Treponema sp.]
FIHVIAPCPTGWGIKVDETVELAKEIVDTGLLYLAEYENGKYTITYRPKEFSDVAHYIKRQVRFKHLTDSDIALIEEGRNQKWEKISREWNQ